MKKWFHLSSSKEILAKIDQLSLEIKGIDKLLEGEESVDFTDLSQFAGFPEYNWASVKTFQEWSVSQLYRNKYLDLKRLLTRWNQEPNLWQVEEVQGELTKGTITVFLAPRKMALLQELMKLADSLSQNFDSDLTDHYNKLEAEFYASLTPAEISILIASGNNQIQSSSFLHLFRKYLHGNLVFFIKVIFAKINRDLRQVFRNIIHFLFKNLSDESDSNIFLFDSLDKKFVTIQYRFHDNKGDQTALKKYT